MKRVWFSSDDITINILSRLPAKELHRLKFVSKEWRNLISDRTFINFQLNSDEQMSGFFFQGGLFWVDDHSKNISFISTEIISVRDGVFGFLPENIAIMSSTNGLVCCRSCFPTFPRKVYICNPWSRQWISVPYSALLPVTSIALAFDHVKNPVDVSTNFKLVAVRHVCSEEIEGYFYFDIYSSVTGIWNRSSEKCLCDADFANMKAVFVGGIAYWLTENSNVLMFDLENELSWLISSPLPLEHFRKNPAMCIGESKGKLCLVIVSEDGLQLWILEDHFASQWQLNVALSLDQLEEENPNLKLRNLSSEIRSSSTTEMVTWINALGFKDGVLLVRILGDVYSYRFDSRKMNRVCDINTLGSKTFFSTVVPYSMTLVPLL